MSAICRAYNAFEKSYQCERQVSGRIRQLEMYNNNLRFFHLSDEREESDMSWYGCKLLHVIHTERLLRTRVGKDLGEEER